MNQTPCITELLTEPDKLLIGTRCVDSLSLESAAAEGEAAGVGSVSNADSSSEREEL